MKIDNKQLLSEAIKTLKNAYSPYSKIKVGAAIVTRERVIYTGVNVENASYGLTICAERAAVFKAVSCGEREFEAIAIVWSGKGFAVPCGACLQVLAEFNKDMKIVMGTGGKIKIKILRELLPETFSL